MDLTVKISLIIASDRGLFSADCHGQCGEGEGDCDKDEDCLPGFICKEGGYLGLGNDFCTAGVVRQLRSSYYALW